MPNTADVLGKDLDLVSRSYSAGHYCSYHFEIEPYSGKVWLISHDPTDGIVRVAGKVKTRNAIDLKAPVLMGRIVRGAWQPMPGAYTKMQLENCKKFVLSERVVAKTAHIYQPLEDDALRFPQRKVRRIPPFQRR